MTVKNIRDAQVFDEQRMTKETLFKAGKSSAFVLNFKPGQELASHRHPHSDVYLLVIEGEGQCLIDDEAHEIAKGDVCHCGEDQMIGFKNTGQQHLSVYVVMAPEAE